MGTAVERCPPSPAGSTRQGGLSRGVTQADGNSIDVENESAKMAANALEQQAAVSVAKTRNAILRSAMGVN